MLCGQWARWGMTSNLNIKIEIIVYTAFVLRWCIGEVD